MALLDGCCIKCGPHGGTQPTLGLDSDAWRTVSQQLDASPSDCRALACVCVEAKIGVDQADDAWAQQLAPELNDEQRRVFVLIARRRLSIYLAGSAGVGKTYTLRQAVQYLHATGVHIQICAPTACAAQRASTVDVLGKTMHCLFNIRSCKRGPKLTGNGGVGGARLK